MKKQILTMFTGLFIGAIITLAKRSASRFTGTAMPNVCR